MYEVFVSHEAEKYYKRQNKDIKRRINQCMEVLSADPFSGPHIKRLHGKLEGKYRYTIGRLRVIYDVEVNDKSVKVISIAARGDVYKR